MVILRILEINCLVVGQFYDLLRLFLLLYLWY